MGNSTSTRTAAASTPPFVEPSAIGPTPSAPFPLIADVQLLIHDEICRDRSAGRATLLALRLTNREVSKHAETAFAKAFFTERNHLVTQSSLQVLAQISSRPHLDKHVLDLHFINACWEEREAVHTAAEQFQDITAPNSECFCGGDRSKTTDLFCTILGNLSKQSTGPLRSLTVSDGYGCGGI